MLNQVEIKKDLQIITKIIPCINKYNWDGINFPSEKEDWKKLEKKNLDLHKKVSKNKDFCNKFMPSEDTKILEFNQYQKS